MRYEKFDLKLDYQKLNADNGGYQPKVSFYFSDNSGEIDLERKHPTVVVCPGGGYSMTSDREAEPIALKFLAAGFHVALLRYSVAPTRFPAAIFELASVIAMLREHAKEWYVDADKIVVCGFSAGGHLCASYCTLWSRDFVKDALGYHCEEHRPNGMILGYPVITSGKKTHAGSVNNLLGEKASSPEMLELVSAEKQVNQDTPPAFIWHTFSDDCVPVENSLLLASAMAEQKIPLEMHIFPIGPHGLALSNRITVNDNAPQMMVPECRQWIDMAIRWLENL